MSFVFTLQQHASIEKNKWGYFPKERHRYVSKSIFNPPTHRIELPHHDGRKPIAQPANDGIVPGDVPAAWQTGSRCGGVKEDRGEPHQEQPIHAHSCGYCAHASFPAANAGKHIECPELILWKVGAGEPFGIAWGKAKPKTHPPHTQREQTTPVAVPSFFIPFRRYRA